MLSEVNQSQKVKGQKFYPICGSQRERNNKEGDLMKIGDYRVEEGEGEGRKKGYGK